MNSNNPIYDVILPTILKSGMVVRTKYGEVGILLFINHIIKDNFAEEKLGYYVVDVIDNNKRSKLKNYRIDEITPLLRDVSSIEEPEMRDLICHTFPEILRDELVILDFDGRVIHFAYIDEWEEISEDMLNIGDKSSYFVETANWLYANNFDVPLYFGEVGLVPSLIQLGVAENYNKYKPLFSDIFKL